MPTNEITISDAFRMKTRQVPVIIFLVITTLTSILASILFLLHMYRYIPTKFMAVYVVVLEAVTIFTVLIPIRTSGISSFTDIREVVSDMQDKYKILVATYAWLTFGGIILYPLAHIYTTLNAAPSPWSGVIGGSITLSLAIQAVIINYIFNGSTELTKRDLEEIRKRLDPDDFDFDDYSDEELSSVPDEILQEAKENTEDSKI